MVRRIAEAEIRRAAVVTGSKPSVSGIELKAAGNHCDKRIDVKTKAQIIGNIMERFQIF